MGHVRGASLALDRGDDARGAPIATRERERTPHRSARVAAAGSTAVIGRADAHRSTAP
jgi:hypothetical protein